MRNMRIKTLAVAVCLCLGLIPAAGAATPAGWEFKEVLPCEYDQIQWPTYGVTAVQKNGKWGLVDEAGTQIAPCQYDDMREVWENYGTQEVLLAVEQNGKWGLIDQTGEVRVSCQYDDMGDRGCWIYVDGNVGMLLRVKQNGKQGFIDQTGEAVIPLTYTDARDFSSGRAAVADDQGRWGFIDDTNGKTVISCQYSAAGDFEGYPELAPVKTTAGQWQFIDWKGATQATCQGAYDWVDSFGHNEQFAVVTKDGKKGLIDREGEEFWPCQYDEIQVGQAATQWYDGSWTVYGNQKTYSGGKTGWQYGLLSGDGTVDTGLIYERSWELYTNYPAQGLSSVSKFTGKVSASGYPIYVYGYVDMEGKEVIPCKYDYATDFFDNGPAGVELDGKAGFIDATGQVVIPMIYSRIDSFSQDGMAPVATGTYPDCRWGLIDTEGNTMIPCSYACDWMSFWGEDMLMVQRGGKMGLLALTRPGSEFLELPVTGVMTDEENGRDLIFNCAKIGWLTLEGDLYEGESVLAAMYNEEGKLIKVEVLSNHKSTAWLDTAAATAKLFWLGENQKPQSSAAILWER